MTNRQKKIKENFLLAISDLIKRPVKEIDIHNIRIKISPIDEPKKEQTSIDDAMNLWFRKDYDYNKIHKIEEAIQCITAPNDKFPLWIKIKERSYLFFEILISKRYRSYRELFNTQKYPPFELTN